MRTIEEYAAELVGQVLPALDPDYAEILLSTLHAGETEVAAICAVEDAPQLVRPEQVDELEELAATFEWDIDREVARRVIAKWRAGREAAP